MQPCSINAVAISSGTCAGTLTRRAAGTAAGGNQTTTTQAGVTGPPTFAAMSHLITHYYGLLPGDVHDAYDLLSANYRFSHPLASVQGFYATIAKVTPTHIQSEGPSTVRATITFVTKHGATSREPYRFTVVRRRGTLLIDGN